MRRIVWLCALSSCITISASALAQDDTTTPVTTNKNGDVQRGVEFGARLGAGLGFGSVIRSNRTGENAALLDNGNITVPVQIDIGYRFNRRWYLGGFGSGAWISPRKGGNSFCPENNESCSASVLSIGTGARYHFRPDERFDPSIGLGIGYEWLRDSVSAGGVESRRTFRGLQWVQFQANGDYRVAPGFVLGPYLNAALGQYTNYTADVINAGPLSGYRAGSVDEIGDKRMHLWASLGVRGAFTVGL